MTQTIGLESQRFLLKIARESLAAAVQGQALPPIKLDELPAVLRMDGASFVTLTEAGRLRGCIGALAAYQPLALDVQEHAVAAALQDFRFAPVGPDELPDIAIEVSILTPQEPLAYEGPADLVRKLRPGVDGVTLQNQFQKATFLPQVWETLPNPEEFLSHLCLKMGSKANQWREKHLQVFTYQVQEFNE